MRKPINTVLQGIPTPALLIDLEVMERNLVDMQARAMRFGVALRPHVKTHKIPKLALRQLDLGAVGITVAKLSEAEVMTQWGIRDIFIANQIVSVDKIARLLALSRTASIRLGVDSIEGAKRLSEIFAGAGCVLPYLLEIDTGLNRCGVSPGLPAIELYREISRLQGLSFEGIFTHAGHVYGADNKEGVRDISRQEGLIMVETRKTFEREGIAVRTVSIGSTPTMKVWEGLEGVTEIRPGNYIFNDAIQVSLGVADLEDCALTVASTVISRPAKGRAVIDAGSKALGLDRGAHGGEALRGHGIVLGKRAIISRLSEEHGILEVDPNESLEIGEVIRVIPNHSCSVMNLFDFAYGFRDGQRVEEFTITARGKVI